MKSLRRAFSFVGRKPSAQSGSGVSLSEVSTEELAAELLNRGVQTVDIAAVSDNLDKLQRANGPGVLAFGAAFLVLRSVLLQDFKKSGVSIDMTVVEANAHVVGLMTLADMTIPEEHKLPTGATALGTLAAGLRAVSK